MGRASQAMLWGMRLGILAMIAVGLAVLYVRHHQSPDQEEFLRYAGIEAPPLRREEAAVAARLDDALDHPTRPAADTRHLLVDEIMPDLLRLRQRAELPIAAHQSAPVRRLAEEYLTVIDRLIDEARTAVRAIDDVHGDPREALLRVHKARYAVLQAEEAWAAHAQELGRALRVAR